MTNGILPSARRIGHFFKVNLHIFCRLLIGIPKSTFVPRSPKNKHMFHLFLISRIRAACPVDLINLDFSDYKCDKQQKLLKVSLCEILTFPVTFCLLGPIFL
jgi:hypothetical protein